MPEPPAIARWHEIVRTHDAAKLDALLADDAVFFSPVVYAPQAGRALTKAYLAAALEVIGGGAFRYVGEWFAENSAALEFEAMIDGVEVNGADFIAWDDADRIVRFKVMLRPLRAIELVRQRMAERLAVRPPA